MDYLFCEYKTFAKIPMVGYISRNVLIRLSVVVII